jgi:hypothetical protein
VERYRPRISTGTEITYLFLWLLVLGSFTATIAVIPLQVPVDNVVTVAPNGHFDFNRTMVSGRDISITINVIDPPDGSGYFYSLYIMSLNSYINYTLKLGGSPINSSLFDRRFYVHLSAFWEVPAFDTFYFVVENPSPLNLTARIMITWPLELPLLFPVVLAVLSLLYTVSTITTEEKEWAEFGRVVVIRGDLDMIPDVVTNPPQRLHYVEIAEPGGNACGVCNTKIEDGESVLRCPYCGSASHSEHLLSWVRSKGYCPACKRQLGEQDLREES